MKGKKLLTGAIFYLSVGLAVAAPQASSNNTNTNQVKIDHNVSTSNQTISVEKDGRGVSVEHENSATNPEVPSDIKQLIEKVKNAPVEEKYKYMNQLKLKLREISAEKRKMLINKIVNMLHEHENERKESIHMGNKMEHNMKNYMEKAKEREHNFTEKEEMMEGRMEHTMENHMERIMEREHNLEEKREMIQERVNLQNTEKEHNIGENHNERYMMHNR